MAKYIPSEALQISAQLFVLTQAEALAKKGVPNSCALKIVVKETRNCLDRMGIHHSSTTKETDMRRP